MNKIINKKFFEQDALEVGRKLLGKIIEYKGCKGMIVETEAYKNDQASHAYKITPRSKIMLDTYGHWYIYFVYGNYYCLNITTNKNNAGAVLIRALEPIKNIKKMIKRRNTSKVENLTSGPGKICQALGITKKLNGTKINDKIKIFNYKSFKKEQILTSSRIGIKKDLELPWRFYLKDNKFVTKATS